MSIAGITGNLTIKDFKIRGSDVFVNNNGNPGILLIHAHWCGHCKNFIPTYRSMCRRLNRRGDDYPCLAIESEELDVDGGRLSSALGISGFPTIKFFDQYGKIVGDYNGSRKEEALLDQICKVYHHCITKH